MNDPADKLRTTLAWIVRVGIFLVPVTFLLAPAAYSRVLKQDPNPSFLGLPLHAVNAVFNRLPEMAYGFEAWRNFGFRMLVEVTFGLWVLLALMDRRYRLRRSWLLVALTGFMLVILVADLAGVSPYRSLWSNIERMQGYVQLVHLFAFFLVATSVLTSERLWRTFFWVSLIVCAAFCYEAIYLQWDMFVRPRGGKFEFRLEGRMASPVFFAVFTLLHIGTALFWALRTPRWSLRCIYGALTALFLLALWMTGTRAAFAGLAIGAGVTVALLAVCGESRRMRWVGLIGCGVVALVSTTLVAMVFLADASWNQSSVLERFAHTKQRLRLTVDIWEIAAAGFWDYPILGWGQENFGYVFDERYDGKFFDRAWMWSDRCHNVFLGWALAGGALGLLSYLAVLWGALKVTWQRPPAPLLRLRDKAILTGILVGYLAYDAVQLDNGTSYVVIFALFGFMHWASLTPPEVAADSQPSPWVAIAAAPVVLLAVGWGGIEWANLRAVRTAVAAEKCKRQLVIQGPEGPRLALEDALREECFATGEVRETASLWAQQIRLMPDQPAAVKQRFVLLVTDEMRKEVEAHPRRVRTLFLMGRLLSRTGKPKEALDYFEAARARSPNRPRIYVEFAEAYRRMGDLEKSLEYCRRAYDVSETERARWFFVGGMKKILEVYVGRAAALAVKDPPRSRDNWDRALELCRDLIDEEPYSLKMLAKTMDWMIQYDPPDREKFDEMHQFVKKRWRELKPILAERGTLPK